MTCRKYSFQDIHHGLGAFVHRYNNRYYVYEVKLNACRDVTLFNLFQDMSAYNHHVIRILLQSLNMQHAVIIIW